MTSIHTSHRKAKLTQKWIIDICVKSETIKFLGETGENPCHLG
jgi:hypothetical protein